MKIKVDYNYLILILLMSMFPCKKLVELKDQANITWERLVLNCYDALLYIIVHFTEKYYEVLFVKIVTKSGHNNECQFIFHQ